LPLDGRGRLDRWWPDGRKQSDRLGWRRLPFDGRGRHDRLDWRRWPLDGCGRLDRLDWRRWPDGRRDTTASTDGVAAAAGSATPAPSTEPSTAGSRIGDLLAVFGSLVR
jgi:hypothetical protein